MGNSFKTGTLVLGICMGLAAPALAQKAPINPTETRGLDWLVKSQRSDGAWGFAKGNTTSDPGVTAYAGLALIRAGIDHKDDKYRKAIRRVTPYLIKQVTASPEAGGQIGSTLSKNSQLHYKLGQYVDASLCAQYFARLLPHVKDPAQLKEIRTAADKCLRKLEDAQGADGGWGQVGWAAVLQTGLATQTLEVAGIAGLEIDAETEARVRKLLRTGEAVPDWPTSSPGETTTKGKGTKKAPAPAALGDAGIPLYALAARQRACARDVLAARRAVGDAPLSLKNLKAAGIAHDRSIEMLASVEVYKRVVEKIGGKGAAQFLKGFGNRGGEEVISYLMISESLVGAEDPAFPHWQTKVESLLKTSQNKDGSWVGHHCLTSPTVVTSASVLCLTADREPQVFHDRLATLRGIPEETEPWESVMLPNYGMVSVRRVFAALAGAETKGDLEELFEIADLTLGSLDPGAESRVALLLSKGLASPHPRVQAWAAASARRLSGAAEGQDIAVVLQRTEALLEAVNRGDPQVFEQLAGSLQDVNSSLRFKRLCVDQLVKLKGHSAVAAILSELGNEDREHRRYVWGQLQTMFGERLLTRIGGGHPFDPDGKPHLRAKALKAWHAWASSPTGRESIAARESSALRRAVRGLGVAEGFEESVALVRSRGEASVPVLNDGMARAETRLHSWAMLREITRRDLPMSWAAWTAPIAQPPNPQQQAALVADWMQKGCLPPPWLNASTLAIDLDRARAELLALAATDKAAQGPVALGLARIELRRGDLTQAKVQLERAALAGPEAVTSDALLLQGLAVSLSAQSPGALRRLTPLPRATRLAVLAPWLPDVHEALANALRREGTSAQAKAAFEAALSWTLNGHERERLTEKLEALEKPAVGK